MDSSSIEALLWIIPSARCETSFERQYSARQLYNQCINTQELLSCLIKDSGMTSQLNHIQEDF